MSSPAPRVDVMRGSRSSSRRSGSPLAAAISRTAVTRSPSTPHCASISRPSGSCTRACRISPPVARTRASVVPSPPSASGSSTHTARGQTRRTPRAIALAVGDPPHGIAALARDPDGTLRFAGGEFTDEQDVVAPAGEERSVATAVAEWIASAAPPRVRLEFVPEDAPTLEAMATVLSGRGYRAMRSRLIASPRFALPRDFETYVQSLGKKERHELRRKIRRLENATKATFRWASTDAERGATLDRFFALHRLSRGAKADFMTPDLERFFRDIADALAPLGRLRLGVLRAHDEDAAVVFAFA